MRKMALSLILLSLTSMNIEATEVTSASVKKIMMDRNLIGKVFIQLNVRQPSTIECHHNSSWEYVLDITDDYGKHMYSTLLTLYASGKQGLFAGDNLCSQYKNIETLRRIEAK